MTRKLQVRSISTINTNHVIGSPGHQVKITIMMKRLLTQIRGVMALALKASTRTRVIIFLVLLQVICALTLPRAVKGDGTPAGELEILLTYTLGFSFAIQVLATLWAACSLFAGEIKAQRIQMTVVKPVGFAVLWLGRWLSLLVLNAIILVIVYLLVYLQIRVAEHRGSWSADVIPRAHHVARPNLPSPLAAATIILKHMKATDAMPEKLSEAEVLSELEEQERERYDIINPGDQVKLNFDLPRPVREDEEITVRLKFDTEYSTREHVKGVVRLSVGGDADNSLEQTVDNVTQNELFLAFKASHFLDRLKAEDQIQSFNLSFVFEGKEKKASALMLRFRQDVALMLPGGSFEMNLVRSAFQQGCMLAALAAFGLMLSACFSFPVASFAATVVLMLVMIGGGVLPMVSKEDERVLTTRIGVEVLRSVRYVTKHSTGISPLTSVVRGERIERETMLIAALWNMALIPLVLAVLACAVLRRRELAQL